MHINNKKLDDFISKKKDYRKSMLDEFKLETDSYNFSIVDWVLKYKKNSEHIKNEAEK